MNTISKTLVTLMALPVLAMAACQKDAPTNAENGREISQQHIRQETQNLNAWFKDRYAENLAREPQTQTRLGIAGASDKLDDVSQAALDEGFALGQQHIAEMRDLFDMNKLDKQGKISFRLFAYNAESDSLNHPFSGHEYVFDHMSGPHSGFPAFMVNFHNVKTADDARDYIARLLAAERYFGQFQARAEAQYNKDIRLPKFVYAKLVAASRNVITGAPFSEGSDSPLYADIKGKIEALGLDETQEQALITDAIHALQTSIEPAYSRLIVMFEAQEMSANTDDGVWKLPDGQAFYQARLKSYTTTNLTADEIHNIGLEEVARIQDEMRKIMQTLDFKGNLQDFYAFLRTDPQFTLANTDQGRAQYISEATAIIDHMKSQLDGLFIIKPKADMIVKRVEPFRQASAFGAFYERPSLDGTRPGTYFINLRDVREQPTYLMQALAYHEGLPGHHMQIAIGQELVGIPAFRKQGLHTAYVEGWALYAETVPAELGLYTDPYSDFGRLSMEIFRAARLVVDTGLHTKKWTREQAVQYMLDNIANTEGDIRAEIDRYIVWPGQATAYKIGMLKIQELKKTAQAELGDDFDIREFHDVILANGSVPLSVLEDLVTEYIAHQKG